MALARALAAEPEIEISAEQTQFPGEELHHLYLPPDRLLAFSAEEAAGVREKPVVSGLAG